MVDVVTTVPTKTDACAWLRNDEVDGDSLGENIGDGEGESVAAIGGEDTDDDVIKVVSRQ